MLTDSRPCSLLVVEGCSFFKGQIMHVLLTPNHLQMLIITIFRTALEFELSMRLSVDFLKNSCHSLHGRSHLLRPSHLAKDFPFQR